MPHSLRPCLKHDGSPSLDHEPNHSPSSSPFPFAACSNVSAPTRVRFPPTPSLVSTHLTHSPRSYDRAPIVVSPNACALPARNDRTYTPSSEPSARRSPPRSSAKTIKGSYFHPKAFEACEREPIDAPTISLYPPPPSSFAVPALVHDHSSSESDESDTSVTTPPDPSHPQLLPPISFAMPTHSHDPKDDRMRSFFSQPPSPKSERNSREKKRSPSRTRGQRLPTKRSEFAVPDLDDDGCLGGF
ncbi:uncharacterized protein STEHIDRAFT_144115 [Stereum hirsutum FP-91666 SS1]|uniref:uncharacterized protein n=1 Tax=Stereum hirsutum (strain FP-91666) TaxID=721885 RepID=UPI000440BD9D|nr:uncharacterized protein STEHIDRAFT_144115 [Stereum hirsutum FP-91666 SS1]EIM92846.1 hypothetical protein STEHIDRAFT_144115 [Stereum hirsutum FP-91666 SS1]